MNILIILSTCAQGLEAVQSWQGRLNQVDRLYLMSIVKPKVSNVCGVDIHWLQVDDANGRRWQPRLIRALGWRLLSYGAGVWSAYLSSIWPEFLFNVQSFDPDIIDLRWLRNNGELKRKLENGRWQVVSSESGHE